MRPIREFLDRYRNDPRIAPLLPAARHNLNDLLDADLAKYAAEVGPEPVIDRTKPDLVEQHRRWKEWWLEWYRRPLQQPGDAK